MKELRNTKGELHCIDGPAVVDTQYDYACWYVNGTLHRVGGPAIERWDREVWMVNGNRHRVGGPAFTDKRTGNQQWWFDGVRHRVDGPAIVDPGFKEWYINGQLLTEAEHDLYAFVNGERNEAIS